MEEIIQIQDQFYILATSPLADEHSHVLKHKDTFAVFDHHGDIRPISFRDQGIFHDGTRFLSRYRLKINGKIPLLLSSTIKENNDFLMVDLTNPDFRMPNGSLIKRGTLYIERTIFVYEGCFYEYIKFVNFGLIPVSLNVSFEFDSDYMDIFEVRGLQRKERGTILKPLVEKDRVILRYEGLDNILRKTTVTFTPAPQELKTHQARFTLDIDPHEEKELDMVVTCEYNKQPSTCLAIDKAFQAVRERYEDAYRDKCLVETSNEQFNDWLNRSRADLFMLLTETPYGLYPYAGIPWYNTVFGRDGLITAIETLWLYPEIAEGVLNYLAHHQALEDDPEIDAEPGKILHEKRRGEMANLGEIPFRRYYGTVDATPLFVILAGYFLERTGNKRFIERLWPAIERALRWIDEYGDMDGDVFIEYRSRAPRGLVNQGWKDSNDAIFHKDGVLALPPISLCEVQGYVYEAKIQGSKIAFILGYKDLSQRLINEAVILKKKFHQAFWSDEIKTFVLALDRDKRPCEVKSSNGGQCLFTGIATEEQARLIGKQLLEEEFFTGWGIRTIARGEKLYNPMSYHNGSIWPHDNALIAYGLSRYGLKEEVMEILKGLFDASIFMDLHRLPELFCGFERRRGEGPILYPVACNPQAWASASVFLLLQACLGLSIDALNNKVCFTYPSLPPFLQSVTIKNLKIGSVSLDIQIQRHDHDVGINILRRTGNIEVVVTK